MNWTFEFNHSLNYVKIIYRGKFSFRDSIHAKQEYLSSKDRRPEMNFLVDFRKTFFDNLVFEDLRKTVKFTADHQTEYGKGRYAYLVKSMCDYGITRQILALMEIYTENELMIFLDEREALEWLTEAKISFGKESGELNFDSVSPQLPVTPPTSFDL